MPEAIPCWVASLALRNCQSARSARASTGSTNTYTFDHNATASNPTATVTFTAPFALMDGIVNCGYVWNRVLTAAEIATLTAAPLTPFW